MDDVHNICRQHIQQQAMSRRSCVFRLRQQIYITPNNITANTHISNLYIHTYVYEDLEEREIFARKRHKMNETERESESER